MLPETLGHVFDVPLRLAPTSVAVIQGDTALTYRELDAWCNRVANAYAGLGVSAGDRVALMFSNDLRFLPAFFGPMRIGAVAVPLNIRMGDEALALRRGGRRGDGAGGRPRPGRARPARSRARSRASPTSWSTRPPADGALGLGRVARRRLAPLPAPPARSRLGVHAALHLGLHRQAQGRAPRPRRAGLERRHHPEDGVPRRHRARARRRAALPQERDGRRGEAVPPRGRLARDPARLRPDRGHPRHRPPPGDLPHRRARDVQDDPRREGRPSRGTASARSATPCAARPRCRRSCWWSSSGSSARRSARRTA